MTVIIKVKYRIPGKISLEETEKFLLYLLMEACSRANEGSGRINVIWDREGFTKKNHDDQIADLLKKLSKMLQNIYLERLEHFFILHPNWFF